MSEEDWEDITTAKSGGQWYYDTQIIRLTARFIQRRIGIDSFDIRREIDGALDVGCGIGNHLLYFAEQGLSTSGIDVSEEAIETARERANRHDLDVSLRQGDAENLPWDDNQFDLIISDGMLDHVPFPKAKSVMSEIRRVSRPNAYLFVSLRSTEATEYGRGKEVNDNTYELTSGYEEEMIQHFFDKADIEELLTGYDIFDVEHIVREYPEEFTFDKSYLQSSQGVQKFIDLAEADFTYQHARWWIAAKLTTDA